MGNHLLCGVGGLHLSLQGIPAVGDCWALGEGTTCVQSFEMHVRQGHRVAVPASLVTHVLGQEADGVA